jgi:predicted outer membrane repeat protein
MVKYVLLGMIISQSINADSNWELSPQTERTLREALILKSQYLKSKQNKANIGFVTVGSDSSCDFRVGNNKIQNAIDSGANEIRIASNDIYQELVTISSPFANVTLRGGFSSCTAASGNIQSNLESDWAEITRPNGQSASIFTIVGLTSNIKTIFENIKIVGGDGQGSTGGGSIRIENTESDVILNNVRLTGGFNMATGGGLSVISSNSVVILKNTSIDNNQTSSNGGGIYCNDFSGMSKFSSIILDTKSAITGNTTLNHGGGAYLDQRCLLSVFSGSSNPFPLPKNKFDSTVKALGALADNSGVTLNNANGSGGGVYLSGGAGLLVYGSELCIADACFGDNTNPANIIGNTSNANNGAPQGSGGGIYATGMNTDVTISAGLIADNKVVFYSGGAIALLNNANLTVNRSGSECWDTVRCNYFSSNTANQNGGVIYNDNATANISHAYFEGSRANIGVAIYSTNNAVTNVDTSVFNHNGLSGDVNYFDNALIFATSGADMEMKYVTIADNDVTLGVFRIENNMGTVLLLSSSIVDDANSGPVIANSGAGSGFIFANCVMAHETNSLNVSNNTVDDPEFVNRINRDYHLSNTSPAIDYCGVLTTASNKDMDFQSHGWDNPNLSNFIGPFDVGADENFVKDYFTIGSDAACDFDSATQTIQDVIDTGVGEVRIAHNGLYESPIVINSSVKLRGGYLDCSAADVNNSTTHTTIDAPGGVAIPTVSIQGSFFYNSILIEHITFMGQDANFSAISAFGAFAEIILNDVTITGHNIDEFNFGGGINLSEGAIDLTLLDTLVLNNSAHRGGGIYCDGSFSSMTIKGDSGVAHNTAQGGGGGIYLTNGCELTIYSGVSNPDVSTNFGISDNLSYNEGGGIYADLGAQVTLYGHEFCDDSGCVGNNTNPVNINNNISGFSGSPVSNDRGAGIYVSGQDTIINVYASLFKDNLGRNGGAIYVNDLANLNISRLMADCWDSTKCNYFLNNTAITTGGAIQSDQGQLNISSSYFEENKGFSGSVLYAFGGNSFARIEGSVFNNNNSVGTTDDYVIRAAASATVEIVHATFADNFIEGSATFGISSNSQLRLYSSIVNDPLGSVLDSSGMTTLNCVMVHDASLLLGINIIEASPGFVDRNNRDYHLLANAQAKDVCDNSVSQSQFKDIDFEQRGLDDPLLPNIVGTFDVGADEAFVELIFANGFE